MRSLVFCLILAALLGFTSAVMRPPRDGSGAAWGAFLAQPKNSMDVIFFGSSHVFDGVDPSVLWRRQGIASFSHAGPAQPVRMTKYYVFEALRTQKPAVVAVELAAVSHPPTLHNAKMHQLNVSYMPLSLNKLKAGLLTTPPGERVQGLIALWAYHSRWAGLNLKDFAVWDKGRENAFLRGFSPLRESREVTETPFVMSEDVRREAEEHMEVNIDAIHEIAEACRENDAELLLFLTPEAPPGGHSHQLQWTYERVRKRYPRTRLLDLSTAGAVPGLSYREDFFDGGHLRWSGAEKASAVIADYLAQTYELPDRRTDPGYAHYEADAEKRDAYIEERMGRKK